MRVVDVISEAPISAARSAATDRCLMRSVRRGDRWAVLRVYELAGEAISLGRYHRAPATLPAAEGLLARRLSGGRVWPHGKGFVGVSLILPHRSALVADAPLSLRPEQLTNRYVRGILAAVRLLGADPVYPGRDVATVRRRVFASLSIEVDVQGTTIFEAVLADSCDFTVLPGRVGRLADAGGLACEEWKEEQTVCLSSLAGHDLGLEEAGELLHRGYAEQFSAEFVPRELTRSESVEIGHDLSQELRDRAWLGDRVDHSRLDHRAWSWGQLGVFEVHLSVSPDGNIEEVLLAGDFIANSPAVDELEQELRGCPLRLAAIRQVVGRVCGRPQNFLLGVTSVESVAETIAAVTS